MTAQPETRAITIHVSDRVYAGLIERGRKAGYTPNLYAKLLFEAAYAARCGKGEADPLLDGCVAKSLSRTPPPPVPLTIPRPVPLTIPRPVPIPVLMPVPIAVPVVIEVRPAEPIVRTLVAVDPEPIEPREAIAAPAAPPAAAAERWSASEFIFARLVCREEGVSFAEAKAALAPAYQGRSSLFVLISAVRKKLLKAGVAFEAVDIWGWRVERASRLAADAFLERIG